MSNLFTKPLENYQGRVIGCAPGTHAALTAMISQHVVASIRVGFGYRNALRSAPPSIKRNWVLRPYGCRSRPHAI